MLFTQDAHSLNTLMSSGDQNGCEHKGKISELPFALNQNWELPSLQNCRQSAVKTVISGGEVAVNMATCGQKALSENARKIRSVQT